MYNRKIRTKPIEHIHEEVQDLVLGHEIYSPWHNFVVALKKSWIFQLVTGIDIGVVRTKVGRIRCIQQWNAQA